METFWQQLCKVLAEDFSDLPDVAEAIRVVLRLLIAALLGGLLGWEREATGKAAGLRTHMLVALGAALFVLVPQRAGMKIEDLSRVIQGIAAGIGFLGAGAILKETEAHRIRGLTTAAGIWLTAAVGLAAGLGRELSAIAGTVLALIILGGLPKVEDWIAGRTETKKSASPPVSAPPSPPSERT
jgi:putative Mg2+ transporter-C (MgtC) family protein